jgi:hypothetical protein
MRATLCGIGLIWCAVAYGGESSLIPKHLADAQMLIANISQADNAYQHRDCYIKWKGEDGATRYQNRSDCSDFLALLVEHSYGVTTEQLKEWTGHRRPLADNWHDAIVAGKGFERIRKLSDAHPGDVLAIKFPPHLPDTGHIMTVDQPPRQITAKPPMRPGTQQWDVTIVDSTKSGHGPQDTRIKSDGTSGQGVGRGTIRIYTDSTGAIAGYCWSDDSKSDFRPQDERNMVIGRLDVAR